jgi:thermitase
MKKKIVGILVCMLMIAVAVIPVAGTMKKTENNKSILFNNVPNDPDFDKQYYLQSLGKMIWAKIFLFSKIPFWFPFRAISDNDIDAPEAWDIETGSPDVVIAIIDSGVDYTHPDLAANIWNNTDEIPGNGIDDDDNGYIDDTRGWDFVNNDNDPKDEFYLGTVCAGIAGAVSNNGIGVAGICWNCKIMPVRVANETGVSYWEDIAAGIRYAADNGANVISMSLGDYSAPSIVLDAVNYAYGKGVFLCATAGSDNKATEFYPAAYENVTAVGMTNLKNRAFYISNYGEWVDIAVPVSLIYSTTPTYLVNGNQLGLLQNYSFASDTTSMVAGVAALLLSKDPSLTPDEIKALLCNNTDPYSGSKYVGTGRLNAYKALTALTSSMS